MGLFLQYAWLIPLFPLLSFAIITLTPIRMSKMASGWLAIGLMLASTVVALGVGAEVLAAQLHHLAECATRPNMEIRVLPFSAGAHASPTGAFKLFTVEGPFPQVAHAETPQGAVYIESPDCDRLVRAYDCLRELALEPRESAELISALTEELQ